MFLFFFLQFVNWWGWKAANKSDASAASLGYLKFQAVMNSAASAVSRNSKSRSPRSRGVPGRQGTAGWLGHAVTKGGHQVTPVTKSKLTIRKGYFSVCCRKTYATKRIEDVKHGQKIGSDLVESITSPTDLVKEEWLCSNWVNLEPKSLTLRIALFRCVEKSRIRPTKKARL